VELQVLYWAVLSDQRSVPEVAGVLQPLLVVLGGAAAGSKAEEKLKIKPGVELEVEFDDGHLMVIVQERDDEYAVGDRIRIVEAPDGTLRVRQ
jgi:outer membrane lipoprotein SlyB